MLRIGLMIATVAVVAVTFEFHASALGGIAVGLLSHGHKCFHVGCLFGIQFGAGLFSLDERGSIYGAEDFLDEKGSA
jgi:hypothetical protein